MRGTNQRITLSENDEVIIKTDKHVKTVDTVIRTKVDKRLYRTAVQKTKLN
jgi:hypothetical protein